MTLQEEPLSPLFSLSQARNLDTKMRDNRWSRLDQILKNVTGLEIPATLPVLPVLTRGRTVSRGEVQELQMCFVTVSDLQNDFK